MRHLWLSESGQCWRSFLVALILVIIVTQSCSRPFYTRMFHFSPQKPSRNSSVVRTVWKCVLCLIIDWYWSCNSWCLASHVHHHLQLDLLIDAILAGDRREGGTLVQSSPRSCCVSWVRPGNSKHQVSQSWEGELEHLPPPTLSSLFSPPYLREEMAQFRVWRVRQRQIVGENSLSWSQVSNVQWL